MLSSFDQSVIKRIVKLVGKRSRFDLKFALQGNRMLDNDIDNYVMSIIENVSNISTTREYLAETNMTIFKVNVELVNQVDYDYIRMEIGLFVHKVRMLKSGNLIYDESNISMIDGEKVRLLLNNLGNYDQDIIRNIIASNDDCAQIKVQFSPNTIELYI